MKKIKRALAMIMVATLVLGMCSMAAFADGDPDSAQENPSEVSPVASDGGQAVTNSVSRKSTVEDPITTLPVTKVVEATSNVALPNTEFYVQMVPANADELKVKAAGTIESDTPASDIPIEAGPALSNPYLTFTFGQANKAGRNGKVSMTQDFNLTFASAFEHTGIYRYAITEVTKTTADGKDTYSAVPEQDKESTHYITYDQNKYLVDLYVNTDSTNNNVVYAVSVTKDGSDTKPTSITFNNKIECGNIIISKDVDGTEYTKDEDFTFYIMIPVEGDNITLEDGKTAGSTDGDTAASGDAAAGGDAATEEKNASSGADTVQGQVYDANDQAVGDPITLVTNGADKSVNTVEYGNKFTLKNGQYLMITAPVSMIFKVAELDYSNETYTTSVTYTELGTYQDSKTRNMTGENISTEDYTVDKTAIGTSAKAEGTAKVVYGTTNTNTTTIAFTNTRNIAPTTGINLDFVPYVVVLALVLAAGGAVLIYKKKRTVR
jgi:hypothetical protein